MIMKNVYKHYFYINDVYFYEIDDIKGYNPLVKTHFPV
jgi:hypothetical protein